MDVIDLTERELRIYMEDMMQLSQCVVCKATLQPPVIICQQGHLSCHQCHDALKCKVCNSSIVENVQLSTVTKWLQHMPKECKFSMHGCQAVILSSSSHDSYCPYSYICGLCFNRCHILNHFKTKHKEIVEARNEVTSYWLVMDQRMYCLIDGSLFRIFIQEKKGYVTTEVYCIRSKRSDADFIYTMEYGHGDIEYAYTGNVLDYKSRGKYNEFDENFMKFPASKLPYLYEDIMLKFTLRISKLKQDAAAQ